MFLTMTPWRYLLTLDLDIMAKTFGDSRYVAIYLCTILFMVVSSAAIGLCIRNLNKDEEEVIDQLIKAQEVKKRLVLQQNHRRKLRKRKFRLPLKVREARERSLDFLLQTASFGSQTEPKDSDEENFVLIRRKIHQPALRDIPQKSSDEWDSSDGTQNDVCLIPKILKEKTEQSFNESPEWMAALTNHLEPRSKAYETEFQSTFRNQIKERSPNSGNNHIHQNGNKCLKAKKVFQPLHNNEFTDSGIVTNNVASAEKAGTSASRKRDAKFVGNMYTRYLTNPNMFNYNKTSKKEFNNLAVIEEASDESSESSTKQESDDSLIEACSGQIAQPKNTCSQNVCTEPQQAISRFESGKKIDDINQTFNGNAEKHSFNSGENEIVHSLENRTIHNQSEAYSELKPNESLNNFFESNENEDFPEQKEFENDLDLIQPIDMCESKDLLNLYEISEISLISSFDEDFHEFDDPGSFDKSLDSEHFYEANDADFMEIDMEINCPTSIYKADSKPFHGELNEGESFSESLEVSSVLKENEAPLSIYEMHEERSFSDLNDVTPPYELHEVTSPYELKEEVSNFHLKEVSSPFDLCEVASHFDLSEIVSPIVTKMEESPFELEAIVSTLQINDEASLYELKEDTSLTELNEITPPWELSDVSSKLNDISSQNEQDDLLSLFPEVALSVHEPFEQKEEISEMARSGSNEAICSFQLSATMIISNTNEQMFLYPNEAVSLNDLNEGTSNHEWNEGACIDETNKKMSNYDQDKGNSFHLMNEEMSIQTTIAPTCLFQPSESMFFDEPNASTNHSKMFVNELDATHEAIPFSTILNTNINQETDPSSLQWIHKPILDENSELATTQAFQLCEVPEINTFSADDPKQEHDTEHQGPSQCTSDQTDKISNEDGAVGGHILDDYLAPIINLSPDKHQIILAIDDEVQLRVAQNVIEFHVVLDIAEVTVLIQQTHSKPDRNMFSVNTSEDERPSCSHATLEELSENYSDTETPCAHVDLKCDSHSKLEQESPNYLELDSRDSEDNDERPYVLPSENNELIIGVDYIKDCMIDSGIGTKDGQTFLSRFCELINSLLAIEKSKFMNPRSNQSCGEAKIISNTHDPAKQEKLEALDCITKAIDNLREKTLETADDEALKNFLLEMRLRHCKVFYRRQIRTHSELLQNYRKDLLHFKNSRLATRESEKKISLENFYDCVWAYRAKVVPKFLRCLLWAEGFTWNMFGSFFRKNFKLPGLPSSQRPNNTLVSVDGNEMSVDFLSVSIIEMVLKLQRHEPNSVECDNQIGSEDDVSNDEAVTNESLDVMTNVIEKPITSLPDNADTPLSTSHERVAEEVGRNSIDNNLKVIFSKQNLKCMITQADEGNPEERKEKYLDPDLDILIQKEGEEMDLLMLHMHETYTQSLQSLPDDKDLDMFEHCLEVNPSPESDPADFFVRSESEHKIPLDYLTKDLEPPSDSSRLSCAESTSSTEESTQSSQDSPHNELLIDQKLADWICELANMLLFDETPNSESPKEKSEKVASKISKKSPSEKQNSPVHLCKEDYSNYKMNSKCFEAKNPTKPQNLKVVSRAKEKEKYTTFLRSDGPKIKKSKLGASNTKRTSTKAISSGSPARKNLPIPQMQNRPTSTLKNLNQDLPTVLATVTPVVPSRPKLRKSIISTGVRDAKQSNEIVSVSQQNVSQSKISDPSAKKSGHCLKKLKSIEQETQKSGVKDFPAKTDSQLSTGISPQSNSDAKSDTAKSLVSVHTSENLLKGHIFNKK